jgi:hypothetical protein
MSDNDNIEFIAFPGTQIPSQEAIRIISKFRTKYHLSRPENIMNEAVLKRQRKEFASSDDQLLPDDIIRFRNEMYGSSESKIPVRSAMMVLTWIVFPPQAIPVHSSILDHGGFKCYERLYFSVWSTGEEVFTASATEISHYMYSPDRKTNLDYYIFEPDLKWCIAVTHDDDYILTGDFQIF